MAADSPRLPLSKARALAEKVAAQLKPFCSHLEIAGSIRRGMTTCGDIDLVCLPMAGAEAALSAAFRECAMPGGVILNGTAAKRCQLRKSGVQCDLWIAHHPIPDLISPLPCNYGAMLMTYTGSPAFNMRCVSRAKELGHTFRPGHGVIEADGTIHSVTEEEIFAALQWKYIEPADRI